MLRRFYFILLSAAVLISAQSALAITIDTLDGNQLSSSIGAGDVDFSILSTASAIGGKRAMRTAVTSGQLKTELETIVGLASHSQSAGTVGNSLLTWDGDPIAANLNAAGLGGIDFFQDGGTAIRIKVLEYNPGTGGANPTDITITIYDSSDPSGSKYSRATIQLSSTIASLTSIDIPYVNFIDAGPGGAADFHKVGAITLFINGRDPAVDLTLDLIGTNGKCGLIPDSFGKVIDECGVCGGDNSSCADCVGVPNGTHGPDTSCTTTQPGVCAAGTYNNHCQCVRTHEPTGELCDGLDNDCDGEVDEAFPLLEQSCSNGEAPCRVEGIFECDGNGALRCSADLRSTDIAACESSKGCDGVPGSGIVYDECDVCGGDGSSCKDCAGTANGTAKTDSCGVCNGDGSSCLQCQDVNQFGLQAQLDGLAKDQEKLIKNILKRLKKVAPDSATKKYMAKVAAKAHALQIRNWTISWTFPTHVLHCDNSTSCVTVSYNDIFLEYRKNSESLRALANDVLLKLIKKKKKFAAIDRRDDAKADALYEQAVKLSDQVQTQQSVCS